MHLIYLHGFASGPVSTKVRMFREHAAKHGLSITAPDLNVPDFEHLTLTAMIARCAEAIADCPPGPVALIGSSMGAGVALHTVDRIPAAAARVKAMLFLAPGLDFRLNRLNNMGPDGLDKWKADGYIEVMHYAYGEMRRVHYGLLEDLADYDSFAVRCDIPLLLFHGKADETVDYRQSVAFAEGRPNVSLRLVESDHQLLDQVDTIWAEAVTYFGL